ncbi:MAG: hypothetical protein SXU28_12650 [Pseudomonadota bacterium]|nr:hypothetical protein [Pseudomonadota bacterium]
MDFGWIEIIFFYGFALAFGAWQYISTDRSLKKDRAQRLEREAREAAEREKEDGE